MISYLTAATQTLDTKNIVPSLSGLEKHMIFDHPSFKSFF